MQQTETNTSQGAACKHTKLRGRQAQGIKRTERDPQSASCVIPQENMHATEHCLTLHCAAATTCRHLLYMSCTSRRTHMQPQGNAHLIHTRQHHCESDHQHQVTHTCTVREKTSPRRSKGTRAQERASSRRLHHCHTLHARQVTTNTQQRVIRRQRRQPSRRSRPHDYKVLQQLPKPSHSCPPNLLQPHVACL